MILEKPSSKVAYFSMEIALDPSMPTYGGGLGILAGDMLRSAADLEMPMVAVTLVHRKGYFRQRLDAAGSQTEGPDDWNPEEMLCPVDGTVVVQVEDRNVQLRAWRFNIRGISGFNVPVYLLDSDLPVNTPYDRALTDLLYGGDRRYRLCQEVLLGIGGLMLLRSVGLKHAHSYHMNEGHAAFLTLGLLEEQLHQRRYRIPVADDVDAVRRRCVFTTHTPVEAGHDRFEWDLVRQVLGEDRTLFLREAGGGTEGVLRMTDVALHFSRYVNGVAMRHGEVSQDMFPRFAIHAITNGVHAGTWTSPSFQEIFDQEIPEWRRDNAYLRYAVGIPLEEIRKAHASAKAALIQEVERRTSVSLDPAVFTIGFARRAAAYKRADLLFSDTERLKSIVNSVGPFQVIYGGKAHPQDEAGKALIRRVVQASAGINESIRVVYLENYDITLAKLVTSGVDLWLNTPRRPQEASGTSGMKAALNGVPSLSILDGWWIEGCYEGLTGWAIGHEGHNNGNDAIEDSRALYEKLEQKVIPLFYGQPDAYAEIMRSAIALNASFFNTNRMLIQYQENAYARKTLVRREKEVS